MKYRVTAAIAMWLMASEAAAQTPPADKPVSETQAPENQVLNPEQAVTGPRKPTTPSATPAQSAAAKPPKWDVSAPPGMTTRQVRIAVDNGSWMNVDVSHDGKWLAFDLLGDIYTMPIAGG